MGHFITSVFNMLGIGKRQTGKLYKRSTQPFQGKSFIKLIPLILVSRKSNKVVFNMLKPKSHTRYGLIKRGLENLVSQ